MVRYAFHIVLILLCSGFRLYGQDSTGYIASPSLKGYLNANGMLFSNNKSAGMEAPSESGKYLVNNAGIWISATDANGVSRVSAHSFDYSGTDFFAGPLSTNGQSENPALWNKVYKVTSDEVLYHRKNYKSNNYIPSNNISQWPGSGMGIFDGILAPFVDNNINNQIYEPQNGDYPYFTGKEVAYSIVNDSYKTHTYTNALPLGVEVSTLLYRPDAVNDSLLENIVIARILVQNKSGRNYNDFRLSFYSDFMLGDANDNFLSTDIRNSAVICYNGNDSDAVYGKPVPSVAAVMLNKQLSSSMYFINTSGQINSKPSSAEEFRFLMKGKWITGKNLVYGGQGIDNGLEAKYIYPDNQDQDHPSTPWTEGLAGNLPGKRTALLNTDSVQLNDQSSQVYIVAFVFVEKNNNNLEQIRREIDKVTLAYKGGYLTGFNKSVQNYPRLMNIYPNPVVSGSALFIGDHNEESGRIEILSPQMQLVFSRNLDKNEKSIILDKNFEAGYYFVRFITDINTYIQRIIILSE
ncbi:MAG: T9SS type A sorting domain-containing protein [Bacteroidia bacterium]|nr:T9SS type A sorting domain-containing protein [Bacteroidia bacterium]